MSEQTLQLWCGDLEVAVVHSSNGVVTIERVDPLLQDCVRRWCSDGFLQLTRVRSDQTLTSRRVFPSDPDFLFRIGLNLQQDHSFDFALTSGRKRG